MTGPTEHTAHNCSRSCLTLAGLGKLAPNMLLMGFKSDWSSDLLATQQYFAVLQVAGTT